jgi:hypothetical protein
MRDLKLVSFLEMYLLTTDLKRKQDSKSQVLMIFQKIRFIF